MNRLEKAIEAWLELLWAATLTVLGVFVILIFSIAVLKILGIL